MNNGMDIEMIIAREKQRDLLRQAEQERLIRLARAGRETRVRAGRRAWDRLTCWLCSCAWVGAPVDDPALGLAVSTCSTCSLGTGKE